MYPIVLALTDSECVYPGYLYLPGQTVPGLIGHEDTECCYCSNPMTWAGSADPLTGDASIQSPGQGMHDGIVSGIYSPVPEARPMESDYSHLRCVVESCEMGGTTMTVGALDPMTYPMSAAYCPRHERDGADA